MRGSNTRGFKSFILQTLIFFGLSLAIYLLYTEVIILIKQHPKKILEIDYSTVIQIDKVELIDDRMVLTGWGFTLEQDSSENEYGLLLYDRNNNQYFALKMSYEERIDVDNYFLCDYDYSHCGFQASIDLKRLNLKDSIYEVLYYEKTHIRTCYHMSTFVTDSGIRYTDSELQKLTVCNNEKLQNVCENGTMLVCRPEIGAYVYQYKGNLYWIYEKEYPYWDENGDCYVQYQMNTTQVERLPEERLANGWYWGNESFSFKRMELSEYQTDNYRVAMSAIPRYSVWRGETGFYDVEWRWIQYFRILLK